MSFQPRTVFPILDSLPRSYYLGHHAAGLSKMRTMLSQIDLVIECRDYRIPITSRNPMFEQSLAGKDKIVVYTKRDLVSSTSEEERKCKSILERLHDPSPVLFSDQKHTNDVRKILGLVKERGNHANSLAGSHVMIVGMPNVGKSSLLNALRREGLGKGKVAHTGSQPGVTRKIGTSVKIIHGEEVTGSVYLLDTPGVFIPYVPDTEAMLKLALCGSVKDTVVPPFILADYLLYHINQHNTSLYSAYHPPTNDIMPLLEAIAKKTGRLQKGGKPDLESTALWMIHRWRNGYLGRFMLDDVTEESFRRCRFDDINPPQSLSHMRKLAKESQREKARSKRPAVSF